MKPIVVFGWICVLVGSIGIAISLGKYSTALPLSTTLPQICLVDHGSGIFTYHCDDNSLVNSLVDLGNTHRILSISKIPYVGIIVTAEPRYKRID